MIGGWILLVSGATEAEKIRMVSCRGRPYGGRFYEKKGDAEMLWGVAGSERALSASMGPRH